MNQCPREQSLLVLSASMWARCRQFPEADNEIWLREANDSGEVPEQCRGRDQKSHSSLSDFKFHSVCTTSSSVLEYTKIIETFQIVISSQWFQIFRKRCLGWGCEKCPWMRGWCGCNDMKVTNSFHWLSRQVTTYSLRILSGFLR